MGLQVLSQLCSVGACVETGPPLLVLETPYLAPQTFIAEPSYGVPVIPKPPSQRASMSLVR